MNVRDIMTTPVYTVYQNDTIARARNLMLRYKIGRLVVIEDNKPVGIITKNDIVKKLDQLEPKWKRRPIDNIPVNKVMSESLITIFPNATIPQLVELIIENDIGGLPVIDKNENIIGIVTKWDIIRYFSKLNIKLKVSDMNIEPAVKVDRFHTLHQIIHEFEINFTDRVIVVDSDDKPLGIITHSNLAFINIPRIKGKLSQKEIKITGKEPEGKRHIRYVRDALLVAEDVMSSPVLTVGYKSHATDAAALMVKERIHGLPVVNDSIKGVFTGRNILEYFCS